MIGYVTLGTNDIQRAARFYDALLAELGAKRAMEMDGFVAWATAPNTPMLSVIKPYDGKAASVGNGVMIAIAASSKAQVEQLYRRRSSSAPRTKVRRAPAAGLLRRVLPRSRRPQAERVLHRLMRVQWARFPPRPLMLSRGVPMRYRRRMRRTTSAGTLELSFHTLAFRFEGRVGGCNTGFVSGWGGNVTATLRRYGATP